MQNILLLEDDAALGSGIQLALQSQAVQITLCTTLEQARRALRSTHSASTSTGWISARRVSRWS